ncbi:Nudix hydrolase 9 [Asimina triloba]
MHPEKQRYNGNVSAPLIQLPYWAMTTHWNPIDSLTPLGNGAIVETADGKILLLQRSFNVGEFPGHFVFPGGHSEPEEIGISSHLVNGDMKDAGSLNNVVSQEMFDGIIREVVEEIGVPEQTLTQPIFIGVSRRKLNVRPTAFFYLKCNLESKDIQVLYTTAQDGYESTKLYTVSMDELKEMGSKMPGCHRGGLTLYEMMLEAARG